MYEIKKENKRAAYLFDRVDVIDAMSHAIFYTIDPESKSCCPDRDAWEKAKKEFDDWFNDTRSKRALGKLDKEADDDIKRVEKCD